MMTSPAAVAPPLPLSPIAIWLMAIRPKLLTAAVTPVVVGSAVAILERGFAPLTAIVALVVALLLQITSNLANDVFDFHRGADAPGRLGPTRVTQSGLLPPERVLRATGIVIALSILGGLYLVYRGGWPILVIGLLAIISAVAYTAGPYPIGYRGLGELFVFIFFGLVGVAGTAYVQTGHVTALAIIAAIPIGCLTVAILVVNNLRDIPVDRVAGKRTIAVRLGATGTRFEYALLLTCAYVTLLVGAAAGLIPGWWWLPLVTMPIAIRLVLAIWRLDGARLNPLLGRTARLGLLFGLCLAVGIVL